MARIKGSAVKASTAYLQEKLDEETLGKVFSGLSQEDRDVLEGHILLSHWYELSLIFRLMRQAEPLVRVGGGRSLAWEMGRFSADFGLKGIYKVFFKVADPSFIIKKASQVFSSYYDSGSMSLIRAEKDSALMRVTDFDQPDTLFCDRLLGWMERTLELTGAKETVMSHPRCMARGDDSCDFKGRWS